MANLPNMSTTLAAPAQSFVCAYPGHFSHIRGNEYPDNYICGAGTWPFKVVQLGYYPNQDSL